MDVAPEVVAEEQKYFDYAAEQRERMRRNMLAAPGAAAHAGAAQRIRREAEERLRLIGRPDDAVAIGRIDDEDGEVLYLGHHTIFNDESEVVVVNWKAPAAERYFTATHADPAGLMLKRSFQCAGNTVEAYSDLVFRQLAAAVAELEEPDDALLDDLNRDRTGRMREIVKTIQAAQFELIRAPLEQLLVIQGGPGTGKTAVALHRVSWLLFRHAETLSPADVLIIGPSPTFTQYTRTVLPSLGDTSVMQQDIGQLHPPVKRGRAEETEVARTKGEDRMAGLLRRALYDRVGVDPNRSTYETRIGSQPVSVAASAIDQLITRARRAPGTYTERRMIFRGLLADHAADRARTSPTAVRAALEPIVERVWPSFTAAAVLRELLGSRDRLISAGADAFTGRDITLLYRRAADRITDETWSDADLPLLDFLEIQINGVDQQYAHIVVDEAQDLSPMQLRSVAARSATGSMTVVGDIAQSTGPWARDDWDDVVDHLPSELPQEFRELRYGYRVPRQIFAVAGRLLPLAAPDTTAPLVVRDGPADPVFDTVDAGQRAAAAVQAARTHASHGRSVAIVCPAAHRAAVEEELTARDVAWRAASRHELGQGINLVSPVEAKGLEFDAVVVVEPEDIVAEDPRGHRLLYVALTRSTRYLHVVGVNPLIGEAPSSLPAAPEPAVPKPAPVAAEPVAGLAARLVDLAAADIAQQIRDSLQPGQWNAVLARVAELLRE